jgi:hypothetical protein
MSRFLPEALEEARVATLWYENARPGLGLIFWSGVQALVRHFEERPRAFGRLRGRAGKLGARRGHLVGFPWRVLYVVIDNEVVVIGLHHTARGPKAIRAITQRLDS